MSFDAYEREIGKAVAEMLREVERDAAKGHLTLRQIEKRVSAGLAKIVAGLPFDSAGMLDLTAAARIDASVSRMMALLNSEQALAEGALGVRAVSARSLAREITKQMATIDAMAAEHWGVMMNALRTSEDSAVAAEAVEALNTARLIERKLSVIMGRNISTNAYGRASNVAALISEA